MEFKQEIPATTESRKKVLKTIAAFASGEGGKVIFGASDNTQPADSIPRPWTGTRGASTVPAHIDEIAAGFSPGTRRAPLPPLEAAALPPRLHRDRTQPWCHGGVAPDRRRACRRDRRHT